jgi:hypothetical protein
MNIRILLINKVGKCSVQLINPSCLGAIICYAGINYINYFQCNSLLSLLDGSISLGHYYIERKKTLLSLLENCCIWSL